MVFFLKKIVLLQPGYGRVHSCTSSYSDPCANDVMSGVHGCTSICRKLQLYGGREVVIADSHGQG
eukprot:SAG31_NODE_3753_length_3920_cov_7.141848_4_plen_65_part_00